MAPMPAPPARFPRIALVGRYASPNIAEPLASLAEFLRARGHTLLLEAETARNTPLPGFPAADADNIGAEVDLAIVVGGDGTMLTVARKLAAHGVPLIGINQGRLGFLTDIPLARMQVTLAAMLDGHYVEERRTLLAATIERAGKPREAALALNDVVVNRGSHGSVIEIAVDIDSRFVYGMRADGLIVATPTGSTAYALSSGGPIIDPAVPAFALVPVAPHALTYRPVAVADSSVITITIQRGLDAAVNCDGQTYFALDEGDSVSVCRAPLTARFLHPQGHDYFAMLREKLHWSETPERLSDRTPRDAAAGG
ncbi:MAG TPA: NAD kinase [Casimicrobiaceae bacterium]